MTIMHKTATTHGVHKVIWTAPIAACQHCKAPYHKAYPEHLYCCWGCYAQVIKVMKSEE